VQWYAETANGKLYAGQGAVVLDYDGISVDVSSDGDTKLSFTSDGNRIAHIGGYLGGMYTGDPNTHAKISINANAVATADNSIIALRANGTSESYYAGLEVYSGYAGSTSRILLQAEETIVTGWLRVMLGEDVYTGHIFVPLDVPKVNKNYDGNDVVSIGTTHIVTSVDFDVPINVSAVLVQVAATWTAASANSYLALRPHGGGVNVAKITAHNTNAQEMTVVCPCDENGDVDLVVAGGHATNVVVRIWGYYI